VLRLGMAPGTWPLHGGSPRASQASSTTSSLLVLCYTSLYKRFSERDDPRLVEIRQAVPENAANET
jgi:hypothetical protein